MDRRRFLTTLSLRSAGLPIRTWVRTWNPAELYEWVRNHVPYNLHS
jgi:hypothetical protein